MSWHLKAATGATENSDQDSVSIGCALVYVYWMRSLGYTIPQIACPALATLTANYRVLTGKSAANQDLLDAVKGLSITSDYPFAF